MLEQALLRERFEELLDQQRQAAGFYAAWAARLTDPKLRQQVEQIHREKTRHIALTERLLEIVE
jgi:rubrerythrin